MKKRIWLGILFAITLVFVLSLSIWGILFSAGQEKIQDISTTQIVQNKSGTYAFFYIPKRGSDDTEANMALSGSSCGDLKGKIYIGASKKMIASGRFYCLPYIKDISSFLSQKKPFYLNSSGVSFENGVQILVYLNPKLSSEELKRQKEIDYQILEKVVGASGVVVSSNLLWVPNIRGFYEVITIGKPTDGVSDVVIRDYSQIKYTPPKDRIFKLLCWDGCNQLQSIDKIRSSFLFEVPGVGLALSGAFLFFDYSAPKYIPAYKAFMSND